LFASRTQLAKKKTVSQRLGGIAGNSRQAGVIEENEETVRRPPTSEDALRPVKK